VLITSFRFFAKRRGIVIPAMGAGKLKAVVQNVFIGATIAWFAWKDAIAEMHLAGTFRNFWDQFHGWFVSVTLAGAIVLTVYSLLVYLYRYRTLLKVGKCSSRSSPSAPSCCWDSPLIPMPRSWDGRWPRPAWRSFVIARSRP